MGVVFLICCHGSLQISRVVIDRKMTSKMEFSKVLFFVRVLVFIVTFMYLSHISSYISWFDTKYHAHFTRERHLAILETASWLSLILNGV